MKLTKTLKITLFSLFGLMYFSGGTQWLLKNFFQVNNGFGPEPHPAFIWLLRFHGTASVAMLLLLGYLLRDHIVPSFKIRRHFKSGLFLSAYLLLIVLTVPLLLYITDENLKNLSEQIHAYLGLALVLPFLLHVLMKKFTVR